MKDYMYGDTKIRAFQFNGESTLSSDPLDSFPIQFPLQHYNVYPTPDSNNPGMLMLVHCEPSMHHQYCHEGDWIAFDESRPDIGMFFIPDADFKADAREAIPVNECTSLTAANIARQKEWDTGTEPLSLSFKGNELAGETGELCNVLKKLERERLGIPGSRDTVAHAAEEMADVIICVDLIATHLGVDLWTAVAQKFNATSEKNGMKTRLVIPNG